MNLSIDDIYDLFSWDPSCSDEENNLREEQGIAEARKLKNIFPFIQPIVAGKNSKLVWEPCAKVVALKSDEELLQYIYLLLEWLQDMNWPGAEIIFDRLSQIPLAKIDEYIELSMKWAKKDNDICWLHVLEALKEHRNWW